MHWDAIKRYFFVAIFIDHNGVRCWPSQLARIALGRSFVLESLVLDEEGVSGCYLGEEDGDFEVVCRTLP